MMQFMDFPGLFVLSHKLPGALQKKVLAKGRLVIGLKGGLLSGLGWACQVWEGTACLDGPAGSSSGPQRETLPTPHY